MTIVGVVLKRNIKNAILIEKMKRVDIGEMITFSNKNAKRRSCYVSEELQSGCSNKIINAHTISRSIGLKNIADSTNHVIGVKPSLSSLVKNDGSLVLEKIGINVASTFLGFCSQHDKSLFSCIEDFPFESNNQQCFMLMYRSLCKEIHAKLGAVEQNDFLRTLDMGHGIEKQEFLNQLVNTLDTGVRVALNDLEKIKTTLDKGISENDFSKIKSLTLKFSKPIPVAVSSLLSPEYDFESNKIQDLLPDNYNIHQVSFNTLEKDGFGYIVFSWLNDHVKIKMFIDSLIKLNKDCLLSTLINFFYATAEKLLLFRFLVGIFKRRTEDSHQWTNKDGG